MSVTTMTIDALCVSPFNVRQKQHDANAITGMAESLATRGQLYPLVVHPMPAQRGRKKRYGALAGGRRFRAFAQLISDGRLPADHPIDVIVREIEDEGELRELSLAENLVRVDLRPYEVYAAVARANATGRSLKEIADTNGQTVDTVRRWARLGNLHPTVFAALEAGEISQDVAKAFGATDDVAVQLHVYEKFLEHPHRSHGNPAALVRRLLKIGDRELEKMLRFVGETAYADAGGRYELDLFADQAEQRGRVADEGLLLQLADANLDAIRARVRRQCGRDLRFEPAPPRLMLGNYDQGVDNGLEIVAEPEPVDAADAAWLASIRYEMAHLEEWAIFHSGDADMDEDLHARCIAAIDAYYVPLEEELALIEDRMVLPLPAGQVYATLVVQEGGEPELRYWWASRKEKQKAEAAARKLPDAPAPRPVSTGPIGQNPSDPAGQARPILRPGSAIDGGAGYGYRQQADQLARDDQGLTADGVQIMRSLRREVLRAALVGDQNRRPAGQSIALDYLLWALARERLTHRGIMVAGAQSTDRGLAGLSVRHDVLASGIQDHVDRTAAHRIWQDAVDLLKQHSSMTELDLVQAFDAFRADAVVLRDIAAAIVAGCALERSANAPGYEIEMHDHIALLAGYGDDEAVRSLIEPTEEFVALLPRARQLEQVHPHVTQGEYLALEKRKAADLPAPVARALGRAKDWVHPMIRFRPRLAAVFANDKQLEAAE